MMTKLVAMLWMTVAAACMAALLAPVSALSPRRPLFDAEDEPIRRRDLGDVLMAEKRAPFTDTFRNSGRPSRAQDNEILPRGLQDEKDSSADEKVTRRPDAPLRWG
ncbi:uncharacterized protein LOC128993301 [Macrosteles quadrilineatus]|uniref:uncharacterized protein LOC128993301 n=1 Tax=Macrosteles quadrilineatus TaxID=74068 RepID=UPI0023E34238|nr:uncharacterized protein LOC128993301 [Macrosteles quadrilineatus]